MPPTILVVEDDEALAIVVARVAGRFGFRVLVAASATAALSLAANEAIDLVIADVRLPGLTGPDVVTLLRGKSGSPPVLFMSADGSLSTLDDALRMPRSLFLPKPFSIDELSHAIWEALAQR